MIHYQIIHYLQCIFLIHYVICLVAKSCPILLQHHGVWPARLLFPQDSPNKHTGGAYHFLLQLYDLTFLIMTHGYRTVQKFFFVSS